MKSFAFTLGVSSLAILPLTLVAVNFSAAPASASIVIGGTGGPDLTTINGALSDLPDNAADDFQLNQGITTITDLHWWGGFFFGDPAPDNFFAAIFSDNNGLPGSIVASPTFVTPITKQVDSTSGGVTIYKYSVDIDPVTLNANTTYWLDINNNTTNNPGNWFWSTHNSTGSHINFNPNTGQPEVDRAGDLAFEITGVPEPLTLGGVALAGVFGAAFKRKLNKSAKENGDKS